MAQNPFKPDNNFEQNPKRNAFDNSFTNNTTFNVGQLIPFCTIPTIPGDTHRIDVAAGLRLMPLLFPTQCKMKAYFHFFYQRNKNLWNYWKDFIYYNDGQYLASLGDRVKMPYHVFGNKNRVTTGSLYDHLGLPTTLYNFDHFTSWTNRSSGTYPQYSLWLAALGNPTDNPYYQVTYDLMESELHRACKEARFPVFENPNYFRTIRPYVRSGALVWPFFRSAGASLKNNNAIDSSQTNYIDFEYDGQSSQEYKVVPFKGDFTGTGASDYTYKITSVGDSVPVNSYLYTAANGKSYLRLIWNFDISSGYAPQGFLLVNRFNGSVPPINHAPVSSVLDAPVWRDYDGQLYKGTNSIKFNALRARCYESIYNSFYRDSRNNPLKANPDGTFDRPVYNQFLTSTDGGPDSFPYVIHSRNWEFDQFTSAVPSPQQGTAPLVGISSTGSVSFQSHEDGKVYTFSSETGDDASTITGIKVTQNVPGDVARAVVNTVTQGISINDFRNVNAMQKWLETNIRRGMKYKDQMQARWGVNLKESLLDMPEFIGGFSIDIDINQISQTVETDVSPLGSYAGQGTGFGSSKHSINCFCDDYGYIMGIVSVVPEPLYDQLIDKDWFKTSPLDYFSPEFSQIGMQPVTMKELAPLCVHSNVDYEKTFGYQRPWYEYLIKNNEIHGLFRSSLRNFVYARNFDSLPALNSSFTTIDSKQLNNIFSVDTSDKILAQIRCNITSARPIPSTHVPSLG